jgi:hypothetical protein
MYIGMFLAKNEIENHDFLLMNWKVFSHAGVP